MNDLIIMAIQGGRYLDAEKQIGELILGNPSSEDYYLLGTIKMNLLLNEGRNFAEIKFCFDKALSLSDNRRQVEKDIMVFSLGVFKQLSDFQKQLEKERKQQRLNLIAGIATTFIASKFYENSKSTFGSVSSIVGISLGIGVSLESLKNLGDIPSIIIYLEKMKKNIFDYLEDAIVNEKKLLQDNLIELEYSAGKFQKYDNSIDITSLEELNRVVGGGLLIDAAECAEMAKADAFRWARNTNNKLAGKGDGFKSDKIICGISISENKINFILTSEGLFHHYGGFLSYKDNSLKISTNMLGVWIGMKYFGPNKFKSDIATTLNQFFDKMRKT